MTSPVEASGQQPNFPLFARLPAELRLQIWELSRAHRIVTTVYDPITDNYHTLTAPPTILQVNRESRLEGQRLYKQFTTSTTAEYSGARPRQPEAIYFSPDLDILYIPRPDGMGYSTAAREIGRHLPSAPPLVRRLAIDHVDPAERRPWETYSKHCLIKSFPHLEDAYLVVSLPGSAPGDQATRAGGQIEFDDPNGDPETILRLMESVSESLAYEVGPRVICQGKEEDTHGQEVPLGHDNGKPAVSLVPKVKITRQNVWDDGRHRR